MGHLGLLPQSAAVVGGYKVQGKTAEAAQQLIEDARACEAAGAFMVVLECIPYQLADEVSAAVSIPVIGIGAGAGTDGQVLVFHDTVNMAVTMCRNLSKRLRMLELLLAKVWQSM